MGVGLKLRWAVVTVDAVVVVGYLGRMVDDLILGLLLLLLATESTSAPVLTLGLGDWASHEVAFRRHTSEG